MYVVYTSDNTAETGFRYQLKLTITDGSGGTLTTTTRIRPNSFGKLAVDISSLVTPHLEPEYKTLWDSTSKIVSIVSAGAEVDIEVKEFYDNSEQGTASTYTFYVVKGYGQQSEGNRPDRRGFTPRLASTSNGSLSVRGAFDDNTDTPYMKIPQGLDCFMSFAVTDHFHSDTNGIDELRVQTGSGSVVSADTFDLTVANGLAQAPGTTLTNGNFYHVLNMGRIIGLDLAVGTKRIVSISNGQIGTNTMTKNFKFEVVERQSKHDDLTVVWLNEYGGLDTMYIQGRLKKRHQQNGETMQRLVANLDNNPQVDKYRHTTRPYHMTVTTTIDVVQNHLTDMDIHLCRSLQRSRQAWLREGENEYQPVVVDTIDFDDNTYAKAQLRPGKFTFTIATEQRC